MKQIYWVRHCKAEGQSPEAPLTELGGQQADALADFLCECGIRHMVSSPFVRARDSVVPLASRLGLPIVIDNRLSERNLGDAGSNWDAVLPNFKRTFDDLDLVFPGGESSRTAMNRAIAAVNDALKHEGSVLMASHGNLTTLMLRHYDGSYGFEAWQTLTNPDVFVLTFDEDHVFIKRIRRI